MRISNITTLVGACAIAAGALLGATASFGGGMPTADADASVLEPPPANPVLTVTERQKKDAQRSSLVRLREQQTSAEKSLQSEYAAS